MMNSHMTTKMQNADIFQFNCKIMGMDNRLFLVTNVMIDRHLVGEVWRTMCIFCHLSTAALLFSFLLKVALSRLDIILI